MINRMGIFTHASKGERTDGLEFADAPGSDTLTREDISKLPILPWGRKSATTRLHGCNTGLIGTRGWCPAQEFADRQGRPAFGEVGYTYFSTNEDEYKEIGENDTRIYLAAYRRRRNAPFGDGKRIRHKLFRPSSDSWSEEYKIEKPLDEIISDLELNTDESYLLNRHELINCCVKMGSIEAVEASQFEEYRIAFDEFGKASLFIKHEKALIQIFQVPIDLINCLKNNNFKRILIKWGNRTLIDNGVYASRFVSATLL